MLHHGSNRLLAQAMDGHILHCHVVSSCQSPTISESVKHCWARVWLVSSTVASTRRLYMCDICPSSIMPSFHHSIVPCRCTVAVLSFRSYHCRCRWERNCWKHFSVYIGMKWPERWLAVHLRQNGENRIRSYLLRNGSYGTTAGGKGNGTTEFFLRKQCNS